MTIRELFAQGVYRYWNRTWPRKNAYLEMPKNDSGTIGPFLLLYDPDKQQAMNLPTPQSVLATSLLLDEDHNYEPYQESQNG